MNKTITMKMFRCGCLMVFLRYTEKYGQWDIQIVGQTESKIIMPKLAGWIILNK